MNRGVLMTPFHNMALMSPATTAADVDRHTEVFDEAVAALVELSRRPGRPGRCRRPDPSARQPQTMLSRPRQPRRARPATIELRVDVEQPAMLPDRSAPRG